MPYPIPQTKKRGWAYELVEALDGGINISVRSDKLEQNELLTAKNVLVRRARLELDTGYHTFGQTLRGIAMGTWQFIKQSGASQLVCITTETVYRLDVASETWQYVAGDTSTTTTASVAQGGNVFPVTSVAGFAIGDFVGVQLADGSQLQSTLSAVGATSVTTVDAIPTGKSASSGAQVVKAVVLQGDIDHPVVAETVPADDWLVFTNGIDNIKRYDMQSCVDLPGLTNTSAKWLKLYNDALFLINTTEAGVPFPRRVRVSDSGDVTAWGPNQGTASTYDLADFEDPLQLAEILGPYIIVYGQRQIYRGQFIGTGGINYNFDVMIRGEGAVGPYAVADTADAHYVMAQSNVYAYRGGFDLEPVGDNVYYRLFGATSDVNPGTKDRTFSFYVEELDEVWIFHPTTKAQFGCDRLFRYNIGDKAWTERVFADEFIGFGFYQTRSSRPWTSLVGIKWNQMKWKWNSQQFLSNSPTTHLTVAGGANSGKVMEYDYVEPFDNGVAIPYTVESKDFIAPDTLDRFDMLEMEVQGKCSVQASIDEGRTWIPLGDIDNLVLEKVQLFQQFSFNKLRFRWLGQSDNFRLTWFGFSYRQESLYGVS